MEKAYQVVNDIKAGKISPLYLLMGEEPYYIDKISDFIEQNVLNEEEKSFNQTIVYGRDSDINNIISACKRYPMMADRQVVIVREAQDLSRTIDSLDAYAANPMESTVLVICYKYALLDKRKKVYKSLAKNGVVVESPRVWDNQIADWIRRYLAGKKYNIEPRAADILGDYLGSDLSRIANELEKLFLSVDRGATITPQHIEDNIGISKDFNNFEFTSALAEKDAAKAYRIARYFGENPRDNPLVVTLGVVYRFFSQLMYVHGMKDKSSKNIVDALKVNKFKANELVSAARKHPMKKVSAILAGLRKIDAQGKGIGASLPVDELLKELLIIVMD